MYLVVAVLMVFHTSDSKRLIAADKARVLLICVYTLIFKTLADCLKPFIFLKISW